MRHEHLAGALVELSQIAKTASCTNRVFHRPPEAFDGIEVVTTVGREEMEGKLAVIVIESRFELMRAIDPAAIDDHDDLFAGFAKDTHDLMEILAQFLGIKMRHNFREDPRRAILDGSHDAEQDAARDAAPGVVTQPGLACERLFPFDLTLTQRACREASPLGAAPPAQPGEGKAPEDGFIFIE